jgi:hexokinase
MRQSYRARGLDPGARPADVGLILGTGTNLAADLGPAGIRNLESGNFDGVAAVETPYDAALDRELDEPPPGAQRFEKMVSGHYLGEILRRVLRDLGPRAAREHWAAPSALATPFALDGAYLSRIAADHTGGLDDVGALLRALGVPSTGEERHAVRALGAAIARRAARLVGAALVGTLRFLDAELADQRTIAVDGSLWGGYPDFETRVRESMVELVGGQRAARIETAYVKDSTSAGAAVIAAVAAAQRSE